MDDQWLPVVMLDDMLIRDLKSEQEPTVSSLF